MNDDPEGIAARISSLESVTGVSEIAERRLAAGDARFVVDLGVALWQRYGNDHTPPWQYRSAFDRLLRLLALTPGTVEPALEMIAVTVNRRQTRYAASLLASAHSAAELESVFGGEASDELRVCVLHELLLRGSEVDHEWATSRHPLAWLPRSLTALEGRPRPPTYTIGGGSSHVLPAMTVEPARGHGPVPSARETTTSSSAAAIGSAVLNWAQESNGRIEARTFELDAELRPDAVGDLMLSLDLESYRTPTAGPGPCTATQAWEQLFTAASGGGAYGSGEFGAYGRLFAWRSVAALVGAPEDASAGEVEDLAHASAWGSFAAVTDWFERIAWDIGLAVVSPDRRHLAVLAATDTD